MVPAGVRTPKSQTEIGELECEAGGDREEQWTPGQCHTFSECALVRGFPHLMSQQRLAHPEKRPHLKST